MFLLQAESKSILCTFTNNGIKDSVLSECSSLQVGHLRCELLYSEVTPLSKQLLTFRTNPLKCSAVRCDEIQPDCRRRDCC